MRLFGRFSNTVLGDAPQFCREASALLEFQLEKFFTLEEGSLASYSNGGETLVGLKIPFKRGVMHTHSAAVLVLHELYLIF